MSVLLYVPTNLINSNVRGNALHYHIHLHCKRKQMHELGLPGNKFYNLAGDDIDCATTKDRCAALLIPNMIWLEIATILQIQDLCQQQYNQALSGMPNSYWDLFRYPRSITFHNWTITEEPQFMDYTVIICEPCLVLSVNFGMNNGDSVLSAIELSFSVTLLFSSRSQKYQLLFNWQFQNTRS